MRVMNGRSSKLELRSTGEKSKYTPEFKAKVTRYAIENGNCQATRKFSSILMKLFCSRVGYNIQEGDGKETKSW